jgi:hypothetical protein
MHVDLHFTDGRQDFRSDHVSCEPASLSLSLSMFDRPINQPPIITLHNLNRAGASTVHCDDAAAAGGCWIIGCGQTN